MVAEVVVMVVVEVVVEVVVVVVVLVVVLAEEMVTWLPRPWPGIMRTVYGDQDR